MSIEKNINQNISINYFSNSEELERFCSEIKNSGGEVLDTYSPIPTRNQKNRIHKQKSRFGAVIFLASLLAFSLAIYSIYWTSAIAYPIYVGGKPLFSIIFSFPVIFEITALYTALALLILFIVFKSKRDKYNDLIDFNSTNFENLFIAVTNSPSKNDTIENN